MHHLIYIKAVVLSLRQYFANSTRGQIDCANRVWKIAKLKYINVVYTADDKLLHHADWRLFLTLSRVILKPSSLFGVRSVLCGLCFFFHEHHQTNIPLVNILFLQLDPVHLKNRIILCASFTQYQVVSAKNHHYKDVVFYSHLNNFDGKKNE